jgi:hypothetical protein
MSTAWESPTLTCTTSSGKHPVLLLLSLLRGDSSHTLFQFSVFVCFEGKKYDILSIFLYDLIEHFHSAHIYSIECSWHLTDVLACSQKVSHPEMRLVSAAVGASFHFPFWELWCILVSVCFHNLMWLAHRDCRIFIVRAWCSECIHTLDLSLSSHPKDVYHVYIKTNSQYATMPYILLSCGTCDML